MATWVTEVGFERPGYSSLTGPDTAVSQARIQQSQRPRIQQSQRPGYSSLKGPGYSSLKGPGYSSLTGPDTAVSQARIRIQQSQRPGYNSLKGPDTAVSKARIQQSQRPRIQQSQRRPIHSLNHWLRQATHWQQQRTLGTYGRDNDVHQGQEAASAADGVVDPGAARTGIAPLAASAGLVSPDTAALISTSAAEGDDVGSWSCRLQALLWEDLQRDVAAAAVGRWSLAAEKPCFLCPPAI